MFFHGNRKGYDWNCILPSQVEDIIINGGEYKEHEHTKVARIGLQDPQAGIYLLIIVVEVASLICTFYHPIKCIVTYLFEIVFKSRCIFGMFVYKVSI